jgi:protein gp37
MADKTEIAWCDSTFNPWIGCTKVGPGCDHCYAEADFDHRKHRAKWGPGQPRSRTSAANWKKPLQWNSKRFMECQACGWRGELSAELCGCDNCGSIHHLNDARRRVFCASLGDVFDNEVSPNWRFDLFELINRTPNLDWLLLTKRIGNATSMIADVFERNTRYSAPGQPRPSMLPPWPWPNVWIGATICNQAEADRDIPKLLAVPARVRFLSIEPMLGPIDLDRWINPVSQVFGTLHQPPFALSLVIIGGESGPHAREFDIKWPKSIVSQCTVAGIPPFVKQMGSNPVWHDDDGEPPYFGRIKYQDKNGRRVEEWPEVLRVQQLPETQL